MELLSEEFRKFADKGCDCGEEKPYTRNCHSGYNINFVCRNSGRNEAPLMKLINDTKEA